MHYLGPYKFVLASLLLQVILDLIHDFFEHDEPLAMGNGVLSVFIRHFPATARRSVIYSSCKVMRNKLNQEVDTGFEVRDAIVYRACEILSEILRPDRRKVSQRLNLQNT